MDATPLTAFRPAPHAAAEGDLDAEELASGEFGRPDSGGVGPGVPAPGWAPAWSPRGEVALPPRAAAGLGGADALPSREDFAALATDGQIAAVRAAAPDAEQDELVARLAAGAVDEVYDRLAAAAIDALEAAPAPAGDVAEGRELWGDEAPAAPPPMAAAEARARVAALRDRVRGGDARAMDAANAAATAAFAPLARPTVAQAALARRLSDLQGRFGDGFVVIVRRAAELLAAPELSPARGGWAAPAALVGEVLRLERRAADHEASYGRFVGALTDACAAVAAGDAAAAEEAAEDAEREAPEDVRAGLRAAAGLGDAADGDAALALAWGDDAPVAPAGVIATPAQRAQQAQARLLVTAQTRATAAAPVARDAMIGYQTGMGMAAAKRTGVYDAATRSRVIALVGSRGVPAVPRAPTAAQTAHAAQQQAARDLRDAQAGATAAAPLATDLVTRYQTAMGLSASHRTGRYDAATRARVVALVGSSRVPAVPRTVTPAQAAAGAQAAQARLLMAAQAGATAARPLPADDVRAFQLGMGMASNKQTGVYDAATRARIVALLHTSSRVPAVPHAPSSAQRQAAQARELVAAQNGAVAARTSLAGATVTAYQAGMGMATAKQTGRYDRATRDRVVALLRTSRGVPAAVVTPTPAQSTRAAQVLQARALVSAQTTAAAERRAARTAEVEAFQAGMGMPAAQRTGVYDAATRAKIVSLLGSSRGVPAAVTAPSPRAAQQQAARDLVAAQQLAVRERHAARTADVTRLQAAMGMAAAQRTGVYDRATRDRINALLGSGRAPALPAATRAPATRPARTTAAAEDPPADDAETTAAAEGPPADDAETTAAAEDPPADDDAEATTRPPVTTRRAGSTGNDVADVGIGILGGVGALFGLGNYTTTPAPTTPAPTTEPPEPTDPPTRAPRATTPAPYADDPPEATDPPPPPPPPTYAAPARTAAPAPTYPAPTYPAPTYPAPARTDAPDAGEDETDAPTRPPATGPSRGLLLGGLAALAATAVAVGVVASRAGAPAEAWDEPAPRRRPPPRGAQGRRPPPREDEPADGAGYDDVPEDDGHPFGRSSGR